MNNHIKTFVVCLICAVLIGIGHNGEVYLQKGSDGVFLSPANHSDLPAENDEFVNELAKDTWTYLSSDWATDNHLPWSWRSETLSGGDYANPAEIGFYALSWVIAYDLQQPWSPGWFQTETEVMAILNQLRAWQTGSQSQQPNGPNAYQNKVFYQWYWINYSPPVVGTNSGDNQLVPSVDNAWLAASLITIREYGKANNRASIQQAADAILADMDFMLWYHPDTRRFSWGDIENPQGGTQADYYSNENRIINFVARALGQLDASEFQLSLEALMHPSGTYDGIMVEKMAWDGSYFTYLSPALFIREMDTSYGEKTIFPASQAQINYAKNQGYTAWGLSDCYEVGSGNYVQQGSPPVPMLDPVETNPGLVSPHASALALITKLYSPAITNLHTISSTFPCAYHPVYGFRDSVMANPNSSRYQQCSNRFSALNQEWIFLSIANFQNGFIWKYFYRDPGVRLAHQEYADKSILAISGNVRTSGVTLNYSDGSFRIAPSDADGNYTITIPSGWSGAITPSKPGYAFSPTSISFTDVQGDFINQDFSVVTWPAWVGGVSLTSDQPVVAVGRPHVEAEVMTYNGFGGGSTTMYVPMLFKNAFGGDYKAALYLQNVSDSASANVSISYYDSTGALTCSVTGETLAPLASKGYWLPTIACLPAGWVGGAVVTSSQPIVAVGRPHIGSQVTTYAGFGSGSLGMYVPMLFKNAFGGDYNAALYIQNANAAQAAMVEIGFYDSAGSLTCAITGETIAPLATKGYWMPSVSCLPNGWVGGAVITSNREIVAIGRPHVGSQVTTYNGFSAGSASLRVPMLFKGAFGGTYNAALYIQNTDSALDAAIDIDFYDSNGNLTCSLTGETIPALATKGYWMPSVACLPAGWVGGAVITANRNVVAVGRPHVGAEVATYGGFAAGSTGVYLPMLFKDAFGGIYDSAFYVQNTSSSSPANMTFKFYDTLGNLSCLKHTSIPARATVGYWLPTLTCTP